MKAKIVKWLTIVVFCGILFTVGLVNLLTPIKEFSVAENRFLAQFPAFSLNSLFDGTYTKGVEDYLTDQFMARDMFVSVKSQTDYSLGKRESNGVIFGDDNYLFKRIKFDEKQFQKNINWLEEYAKTSENLLGKEHVATMFVPMSGEILSDKLPKFATDTDQKQMQERAKKTITSGNFVDIYDTLKSHKNDYIFYKTDHHWTTDGAFLAYQEFCKTMGIIPKSIDDYNKKTVTTNFFGSHYSLAHLSSTKPDTIYQFDLKSNPKYQIIYNMDGKIVDNFYVPKYLEKGEKYAYFLGNPATVKVTSENKNGKKLMIVGDSFSRCFIPLLADDFSEIHYFDLRHVNMNLQDYMKKYGITDTLTLYCSDNYSNDKNMVKLVH